MPVKKQTIKPIPKQKTHYVSEFPYSKHDSGAWTSAKKLGKGTWLKVRIEL
jgi:hypothetical protein